MASYNGWPFLAVCHCLNLFIVFVDLANKILSTVFKEKLMECLYYCHLMLNDAFVFVLQTEDKQQKETCWEICIDLKLGRHVLCYATWAYSLIEF